MNCPACRSQRIHRSRCRGILESALLKAFFVRPFRCLTCDHRFFRWSFNANPSAPPPETVRLP
jgi:hypothetical protein